MAEVLPGFAVYGTEGSFVKERCDVQETQLDARHAAHRSEGFGIEAEE